MPNSHKATLSQQVFPIASTTSKNITLHRVLKILFFFHPQNILLVNVFITKVLNSNQEEFR